MPYLVVCRTNGCEALHPQLNVSRNLCRHGSVELRRDWRICLNGAGCVIVTEHLARAGELEGFD